MENRWGREKQIGIGFLPIISDIIKDGLAKRKQEAKEKIKAIPFQSVNQLIVQKLKIIPEADFNSLGTTEQYYTLCFAGHMLNTLSNENGILEDKKFKLNGGLRNKLSESIRPTTSLEIYYPNFPDESIEIGKKAFTLEARNLAHTFIRRLKDKGKLQEFIDVTEALVKGGRQTHLKQLGELVEIARKSIFDPERKIDPISKSINLLHPLQVA